MTSQHAVRLASITPSLAAAFIDIAVDFAIEFPGSRITPAQGYRTPSKQAATAAAGRSRLDGTKRVSKHQAFPSLALDFAVLDPDRQYVTDGEDPRYLWVGERFEARGFRWGGRWTKAVNGVDPDYDHVEDLRPAPRDAVDGFLSYQETIERAPFLKLA